MPAASRNVKAAELPLKRKNAFRQITLSEDEIDFSAIPLLLPVFPVSLPCRPHRIRINRLPCNGGIPVRVTRLCFRPDCSQVIAALATLFPHTSRKLSENMSAWEVLSCSQQYSFTIRFYYIAEFRIVNKKLDRTLFFTASS